MALEQQAGSQLPEAVSGSRQDRPHGDETASDAVCRVPDFLS